MGEREKNEEQARKLSIAFSLAVVVAYLGVGSYLQSIASRYLELAPKLMFEIVWVIPVVWLFYLLLRITKKSGKRMESVAYLLAVGYFYWMSMICPVPPVIISLIIPVLLGTIEFVGKRLLEGIVDARKEKDEKEKEKQEYENRPKLVIPELKNEKKYINRIFWECLYGNSRNFVLFFLSASFAIVLIFISYAMEALFVNIASFKSVDEMIKTITQNTTIIMVVLSIVLLVMSALRYMKSRMNGYGMFTMLGMRKKRLYLFVLQEYLLCMSLALVTGLFLGSGIFAIFKKILLWQQQLQVDISMSLSVYMYTIGWSIAIFLVALIVCDELISCIGLQQLLAAAKKKEWFPPLFVSKIMCAIGMATQVLILLVLQGSFGKRNIYVPAALSLMSLYLVLVFGGRWMLEIYGNKQQRYLKNILECKEWYHRYMSSVNMVYICAACMFLIVYLLTMKIVDYVPTSQEVNLYPYDLVWMAKAEDESFLNELQEEYDFTYEQIPMVRITTVDYGQNIGIPEDTYEAFSGERIDVEEGEIYVVYQREVFEGNEAGLSFNRTSMPIHIGSGSPQYWVNFRSEFDAYIPMFFPYNMKVAGETLDNKIGVFRDKNNENIIVLDQKFYEKVKADSKESNSMILIRVKEEVREQVSREIRAYAEVRSERYFAEIEPSINLYEKALYLEMRAISQTMNQVLYVFILVLVLACMLMAIGIKFLGEYERMKQEEAFYQCLGIPDKRRRSIVRKQVLGFAFLPVVIGGGLGSVYLLRQMYLRELPKNIRLEYIQSYGLIFLALGIVIVIFAFVLQRILVKKVVRGE